MCLHVYIYIYVHHIPTWNMLHNQTYYYDTYTYTNTYMLDIPIWYVYMCIYIYVCIYIYICVHLWISQYQAFHFGMGSDDMKSFFVRIHIGFLVRSHFVIIRNDSLFKFILEKIRILLSEAYSNRTNSPHWHIPLRNVFHDLKKKLLLTGIF